MNTDLIDLICSTLGHALAEAGPGAIRTDQSNPASHHRRAPCQQHVWLAFSGDPRSQRFKKTGVVADRYRRLWDDEGGGPAFRKAAPSRVRYQKTSDACDYQADHLHEAPVWIVSFQLGHTRTWDAGSGTTRRCKICCWRPVPRIGCAPQRCFNMQKTPLVIEVQHRVGVLRAFDKLAPPTAARAGSSVSCDQQVSITCCLGNVQHLIRPQHSLHGALASGR